jgi:hypothetical protein
MLVSLHGDASPRKLRLFICGLARCLWQRLDQESRAAVEVAERFADGHATVVELERAYNLAWAAINRPRGVHAAALAAWTANSSERLGAEAAVTSAAGTGVRNAGVVTMLREVFDNPFRREAVDTSWKTKAIHTLAATIYEERAFDHLPILADALEEAGCTDAAILHHCRQPGEHVRGCWVIDLLLDKN